MIQLGFACDWKKDRKITWSHIAFGLFEALKANPDCHIRDIDVSLPVHKLLARQLMHGRIVKGQVKSKFRFADSYLRNLTSNFLKRLADLPKLDAILQIGDIAIAEDVPYFIYQDLSLDLMIEYYRQNGTMIPQYEIFTIDDLQRRRDWQIRIFEKCSGVFTFTQWLADGLVKYSGLDPKRVHVVGVGINVVPDSNNGGPSLNNSDPVILFVGRDFFRKGGDLVLEAFNILCRGDFQNVKLVVAGPKRWPLKGNIPVGVEFLGDATWDILRRYFAIADVFCMPSRSEGLGIVFAEALCFGVPCIGKNLAVVREVVSHGIDGYLIEDDDAGSLANLISKVLRDPTMKARVSANVEEYRKKYSWARVAADMLSVIRRENSLT